MKKKKKKKKKSKIFPHNKFKEYLKWKKIWNEN